MNTYKAYKLRIYPTNLQRELIEKTFGCTRYIYNNFLAERKNKNEEVKDLSVRKWTCPECGLIHDRDINASINIMFEGLKIYMKNYLI